MTRPAHRLEHRAHDQTSTSRSPIIWIVTRIRAGSLTGAMSPKPTVAKTVTVKYSASVCVSGSENDPGRAASSST